MATKIDLKKVVLFHYPFLDDETAEACLDYIRPEIGKSFRRPTPSLVFDAFKAVATQKISKQYPELASWQVSEICDKLVDLSKSLKSNFFYDTEKIERVREEVTRLPASSDDVNDILAGLQEEHDVNLINMKLLQIIIYIRSAKKNLHSSRTTEGDNIVTGIETNLVGLINASNKQVLHAIYPNLRELVSIIPKTSVFGIDINELRDIVADYHETRDQESPFLAVAEDIREAVHRRLSGEVIGTIDELIGFLNNNEQATFVSGRLCQATREEKDEELGSDLFKNLLKVKQQLKLIWNDPFSANPATRGEAVHKSEVKALLKTSVELCEQLIAPFENLIVKHSQKKYAILVHETISRLERGKFSELNMGPARYALNTVILDLAGARTRKKGRALLNLMTLDCILENVALVHYSNIVNSRLATITDENYDNGVKILSDLLLCTIAAGQGTRVMRKLALSLKQELDKYGGLSKVDAQNFIGEIDEELVSYIYKLSQELREVLVASWSHRPTDETARMHTQLLNDMIREKTTHLSGNLLSGMARFLGGAGNEATRKLARSNRRSLRGMDEKLIDLKDMVFQFGTDIEDLPPIGEKDWFMGGKGASEVAMSRIVVESGLKDVDVPKGFGLSTQTWRLIKGSLRRRKELEGVVRREVAALEKTTQKRFGDPSNPLILAARSGAVLSMPGVLPTVTHIGLNDEIVREWSKTLAQPYRAYHAYLRFLFNYADAAYVGRSFERKELFRGLEAKRVPELIVKDIDEMQRTIDTIKRNVVECCKGAKIPDDVYDQLMNSVLAVFSFYETDEVKNHYKGLKSIPEEYQTACLIQDCLPVLVDDDCSGVFLTRNPLDGGEGQIEYIHDFGEDLAGGRARPGSKEKFEAEYPSQSERLMEVAEILEREYASPMDIEFAIRGGDTYLIQTRPLKLAPMADVVTNYRFYKQGLMSSTDLIERTRRIVGQPLMNTFMEEIHKQNNVPIAYGQPIAGGVVAGRIIFNIQNIESYPDERIIFITKSNVPRQVTTRPLIDGYISEEGGVTSHASLVSIGKLPCIVGVHWRRVGGSILLGNDIYIKEGEIITLDANDGYIYRGALPICSSPEKNPEYLEAEAAILNLIRKREEYTLATRPPTDPPLT